MLPTNDDFPLTIFLFYGEKSHNLQQLDPILQQMFGRIIRWVIFYPQVIVILVEYPNLYLPTVL